MKLIPLVQQIVSANDYDILMRVPVPHRTQAFSEYEQFVDHVKGMLHSKLTERLVSRLKAGEVTGELTLCGGVREVSPLTPDDLRALSTPMRVAWELGEHGLLMPRHSVYSLSHKLRLDNGAEFEVSEGTLLWREIEEPILTLPYVSTTSKFDEWKQLYCASTLLHYLAMLVHELQQLQSRPTSFVNHERMVSIREELKRQHARLRHYSLSHRYELEYLYEAHVSYDWGLDRYVSGLEDGQNADPELLERLSVYRKGVAALFVPGDEVHGRLCAPAGQIQYVTGVVQSHLPKGRLLLTDGSQIWVWSAKRTALAQNRGERGLTALTSRENINMLELIAALVLYPTVEKEQVVSLLSTLLARMEIRAQLSIAKNTLNVISVVSISPKSNVSFSQDEMRSLLAMFDGLTFNEQRSKVECMLARDNDLLHTIKYRHAQPLSVKQRSIVAVAQHICHSITGTRRVLSAVGEQVAEGFPAGQLEGKWTVQRWFRTESSSHDVLPDVLRFVIERGGLHENELPRFAPDVRPLAVNLSGLIVRGGQSLAQLGHAYNGEFPDAIPRDRDVSLAMLEVVEHALLSVQDNSEQWEGEESEPTQTAEEVHLRPFHEYAEAQGRVSRGTTNSLVQWIIKRGGIAESDGAQLTGMQTVPGLLRRDGRTLDALAELYGLPDGPDVSARDTLVSELLEELGEPRADSLSGPDADGESTVRLH